MMISKADKTSALSLVLMSSLFLLTGCWGEKTKETHIAEGSKLEQAGKSDVLLSIDGKPVLYVDDFEDQKMMAQQSNQQLNMILQMMPEAEYSMLFKSIEAGHLMKEWVVRSGIDQKPELVKQRRQYHEAIDLQLYMKYFEDAHPVHVTDHEVEAFYKAKRDQIPALIISPAGVEIAYVNFDAKPKAEAFIAKVKEGSAKVFKATAKEAGLKFEEMVIAHDSQVNESLKNSVLAITKFPAKEIVKIDDNSYWVVGAFKKKDAEYRSFDMPEVKQYMKKACENEKREVALAKEVEKLSTEYNVVENMAYFENKKQNQLKALNKAQELVMQAQQAAQGSHDEEDVEGIMLDDKI